MGAPTANKKMRCSILFLSLAIIYASASPVDEVVPEESLYALDDDLSEARSTIEQMTTAGKSDKDCRKLVEETRKEVQTNVDTCTKTMDALPKGEACPAKGQSAVKAATEAKSKADQLVITTKTAVTKAESASVSFGSRTFSSLTEGKCESFYTSTSYTTAEATYKSAVTAHTKATGAAGEAAIALKNAVAAAAKEKAECECAVKKDHESKFSTLTKANAANEKAWNFACKVECVLDGKTTCKCSAAPKCVRPKVTAAVNSAQCVAAKKKVCPDSTPSGFKFIGNGVCRSKQGHASANCGKAGLNTCQCAEICKKDSNCLGIQTHNGHCAALYFNVAKKSGIKNQGRFDWCNDANDSGPPTMVEKQHIKVEQKCYAKRL